MVFDTIESIFDSGDPAIMGMSRREKQLLQEQAEQRMHEELEQKRQEYAAQKKAEGNTTKSGKRRRPPSLAQQRAAERTQLKEQERKKREYEKQLPRILREMANNPALVSEAPPPPELIRNYIVNRLLVETQDTETKYRLKALDLLGKLAYVNAFNAEVPKLLDASTAKDLEDELRVKLEKLVKKQVPAIDVPTIETIRETVAQEVVVAMDGPEYKDDYLDDAENDDAENDDAENDDD